MTLNFTTPRDLTFPSIHSFLIPRSTIDRSVYKYNFTIDLRPLRYSVSCSQVCLPTRLKKGKGKRTEVESTQRRKIYLHRSLYLFLLFSQIDTLSSYKYLQHASAVAITMSANPQATKLPNFENMCEIKTKAAIDDSASFLMPQQFGCLEPEWNKR